MFPPRMKLCSVGIYFIFAWFWGLCYGFVLLSSAEGAGEAHVFEPGGAWNYNLHSTTLMNDKEGTDDTKDIGFAVNANVIIESIWVGPNRENLLRIKLHSPNLQIRSNKEPEGFAPHKSHLDALKNNPFYVIWKFGKIEKILLHKNEPLSLANFKKGIASLLQFQHLDQEINETDSSGNCLATYESNGPRILTKTKRGCKSNDFEFFTNPDLLLSTRVNSKRSTKYVFEDKYVKSILAKEEHTISLTSKEDIGSKLRTIQELSFVNLESKVDVLSAGSFDDVYEILRGMEGQFTEESLLSEREFNNYGDVKDFVALVNDKRDLLKNSLLGTVRSVESFIQLVGVARKATKEVMNKVLASKKNVNIMAQLYDILGYVQSMDSHEVAMKKLHFDDQNQIDLSERYLWALSVSSQPNPDIIIDLLNKYKKTQNIPDKVKETLILSIGSMAYRLSKLPELHSRAKVIKEVESTIINYLDASKGEERFQFLRALRNLKSAQSIATLLKIATKGSQKEGVLAWKALKSMEPQKWDAIVLKAAHKTFYEIDKKHDSSSRTLALDILLESQPNDDFLLGLLNYLMSYDKAFEVKQYALQRLRMMAEMDYKFSERLKNLIQNESRVNNYAALGQRGLSVALNRPFLESDWSNGSLLTIQEMHGGIVKRGIVNVMMDKDGISQEIFSLGVFSGGLGGFLSSSESEGEVDETPATAGMELSVLGTQVRPFTFFTGQGELMGHVWSGTASDRTTAFQALTMLHDHSEFIRLGNGFLVEVDIKGATSFDLSGRVEFSLWNRNAESLVEKSAGIMVLGQLKLDTSFIRSKIEFKISIEPKLNLQTDIDFSSGVNLCMRLTQPNSIFRHNISKIESIPGTQYRVRKTKNKNNLVPGKTYALNKKNTDMCNLIFK